MKIKNKKTNNIFNLPKIEVEVLINDHPDLYEKVSNNAKKNKFDVVPKFEQNTILPLIWEGECVNS